METGSYSQKKINGFSLLVDQTDLIFLPPMIITFIFKGHYLLTVCTFLDLETNIHKSRISALEIKYTPSNFVDNGQGPQQF